MKADPKVRPDGMCVQCGKRRQPERARRNQAEALRDPFCASECARKWHGCDLEHTAAGSIGLGLDRGRPRKQAA